MNEGDDKAKRVIKILRGNIDSAYRNHPQSSEVAAGVVIGLRAAIEVVRDVFGINPERQVENDKEQ